MSKTILLINNHSHFSGGGDTALQEERAILSDAGYEVYSLTFDPEKKTAPFLISFKESNSPLTNKVRKFLGSSTVRSFIKDTLSAIRPDLIHIHLVSKYPLDVYACLSGYKVIHTLHGTNLFCATSWGGLQNGAPCELGIGAKCYFRGCAPAANSLLYIQLVRRYWANLVNNVDLFHSPSRHLYASCQRLGLKDVTYQPFGIDKAFTDHVNKPKNQRPVLLFVGNLSEAKGIKVLLQAMTTIINHEPNVILKIAGRGILADWIKGFISDHKLDDNVQILGFVEHSKIRDLYIEADIFVMPSIWQEQFGLVGPEALACETPCVASNVGGIPEWLHHNQWGYLVPPGSIEDLAAAVNKLLCSPETRKVFGKKGREFILSEYSNEQYKLGILQMVESVLNAG